MLNIDNAIPSGYNTDLFIGSPVVKDTNGVLVRAGATNSSQILGILMGVEFVLPDGSLSRAKYWPANQTIQANSSVRAIVCPCTPTNVFEVQANGSLAQTADQDMAVWTDTTAGSAITGRSGARLSTTLVGNGNSSQWRIIGLAPIPGNAWGDAFTIVRVVCNVGQSFGVNVGTAT